MNIKETTKDGWVRYEGDDGKDNIFHICGKEIQLTRHKRARSKWSPIVKDKEDKIICYACKTEVPEELLRVARLIKLAT